MPKFKVLGVFRGASPSTEDQKSKPDFNIEHRPESLLGKITKPYSDLVEERRAICAKCDHVTNAKFLGFEISASRCGLCGCFIKTKTSVRSSTCPDKKW